jgi:geranylgeranyl diphosphate synthase type II
MADLEACARDENSGSKNSSARTRDISDRLEAIHRRKTGALLRAPLQMGAVIVGASEHCVNALDQYGSAIGLAFQIVDDLLDVRGEESKLGKRVGKDTELGKWTYPAILGIDASRRRAWELAEEASSAIESFGELGDYLRLLAFDLVGRDR